MEIKDLEIIFNQNKDEEQSIRMAKYLKNQFEFLGIPKSIRTNFEKEFIKEYSKKDISEIMNVVKKLHKHQYREYMYTAQQLLLKSYQRLDVEDIYQIANLTTINSWWENTDGYIMVVKRWLKSNLDFVKIIIDKYYNDSNFWLRRFALICQLGLKEETNFPSLIQAIEYNINDNEFFIQKAIGWALREYSKTNKDEVKAYIANNQDRLSNLAIREGSKYI